MLADVSADEHDQELEDRSPRRQHEPETGRETAPKAAATEHAPVQRLAQDIGNRNFTQLVARMADGEGILSDGAIHPDVTSAIAVMSHRGGRPMPRQMARKLERTHGDVSDAQIHTGPEAEALSRAVDARAFTVGNHMFFGRDEWQPNSKKGFELAAHEAAHVVQQRGAPHTGSLKVSAPGDSMERSADDAANAALA
jgi:hypothetical protein